MKQAGCGGKRYRKKEKRACRLCDAYAVCGITEQAEDQIADSHRGAEEKRGVSQRRVKAGRGLSGIYARLRKKK